MDMQLIYDFITSKEFYIVLAAFLAALRGLAEFLEAIGRLRKKTTWSDKAGGKLLELVEIGGGWLNVIAPGNKIKK